MLIVVATTRGEAEADLLSSRLTDAGIGAVRKRNIGSDNPEFGSGGAWDVYVEDRDVERARELLSAQDFSDEELAQLSEQSYREITGDGPSSG